MGPWIFFGVIVSIVIAYYASSEALRWIWVIFGTSLALKMFFGRDDWRIADTLPRPPWLEAAAFVIGLISTLMGIGGATFTVPLLTLHGMPLLRAVGTATGIGTVIAIPGIAGYIISGWGEAGLPPISLGYVNLGACLGRRALWCEGRARHLQANARTRVCNLHFDRRRTLSLDTFDVSRASPNGFAQRPPNVEEIP